MWLKPLMALFVTSQVSMKMTRRKQYMEKKFNKPELIVVQFDKEDIITTSGYGRGFGQTGDFWYDAEDPDIVNN